MKRLIRSIVKSLAWASLAATAAFFAMPLIGWSADTTEAAVTAGYNLANLQVDLMTIIAVGTVALGLLLAVAKFILSVVGILSKSADRKAICTQLIGEIDKLKHNVDDVEDRVDATPAATIKAGIKTWKENAPSRVTAELDRLIRLTRKGK